MQAVHSRTWFKNWRTRSQFPNTIHSEDNRACLPGPPCISSWKGATRSVQTARWSRTRNYSRSPNLAPNSNVCESPPLISRVCPREDPKRNPPLDPDTVPLRPRKVTGPGKAAKGLTVFADKQFFARKLKKPSAWGSDFKQGKVSHRSLFDSTPCPSTRIGPSKPVFCEQEVLQIRHT